MGKSKLKTKYKRLKIVLKSGRIVGGLKKLPFDYDLSNWVKIEFPFLISSDGELLKYDGKKDEFSKELIVKNSEIETFTLSDIEPTDIEILKMFNI